MRHSNLKRSGPERSRVTKGPLKSSTPLGDDRFEELIRGASAFFAAAERDEVAEKAQAIQEIQSLMARYGLTTDDLLE